MRHTAAERGLLNPLDPETALPEAAEFFAAPRREFGNLGLAAAYNAGPGRVRDFIDGRGDMPAQTRHYVRAITGRSVEEWATLGRETGKDGIVRPTSCRFLTALLKEPPAFSIGSMERKLRQAAFRPGGIPDGRNASAVQSLTKRVTAGPWEPVLRATSSLVRRLCRARRRPAEFWPLGRFAGFNKAKGHSDARGSKVGIGPFENYV